MGWDARSRAVDVREGGPRAVVAATSVADSPIHRYPTENLECRRVSSAAPRLGPKAPRNPAPGSAVLSTRRRATRCRAAALSSTAKISMKHLRLLLVPALALAFAPAAPLLAQEAPQDATSVEPPQNWWQLDPGTDHVNGIGLGRAFRELLANRQPKRTVVVAIIDSGVDILHPDLAANVWTNP